VYAIGRFTLQPALQIFVLWTILTGGLILWAGVLVYALLFLVLDEICGNDYEVPQNPPELLLGFFIYLSAVLPLLLTVALIYQSGEIELPGFEYLILTLTGIDLVAARAGTTGFDLVGGAISLGVMYSAAAGNTGHELAHRLNRPIDVSIAEWLLALVFETPFAVEHIHGHHATTGLVNDPVTAQRGVSFWRFLPKAVFGSIVNAYRWEVRRIHRNKAALPLIRNRVLRGYFKSLVIAGIFYLGAGVTGIAIFLISALTGLLLIELFNYCGHYGLIRAAGQPERVRHSWCSYRRLSTSLMFNLPRHADHHMSTTRPYWQLRHRADAPESKHGIAVLALIAAFPPVWFRFITPKLAIWDRNFASDEERKLVSDLTTTA